MREWLVEIILLGVLFAYLVYVNRAVFTQRAQLLFDAPMDVVRQLMRVSPQSPFLLPGVNRVEWVDRARHISRVVYDNGKVEGLVREIDLDNDRAAMADGAFLDVKDQTSLGTFESRSVFSETPAGIRVECDVRYFRGAIWRGLTLRLGMPLAFIIFRKGYEPQLKEYCAKHHPEHSGTIQSVGGMHDLAARLGGWPFLLSAAAVLWFVFDLGLWPGLVLIATILIHEGGHLFSMRRHGLQASAVLIPFLGGMAYSSKPMPSDASDAEMTLMGPVFGLALAYLFVLIAQVTSENDFWIAAAAFTVMVNGFNLLPIPPLDGGRYVQLLMRRLGHEVFRWLSLALVVCGVALAWWLSSIVLMVIFVLVGTMLAFAKEQDWDRPRMSGGEMAFSGLGFFVLLAGHLWVLWYAHEHGVLDALFRAMESGPFG
ncbi:MAG: metalloprotease [Rhabdaerophilum sp.]